MVEIIAGEKGKGKTKHLLDRVNGAVPGSNGNIVYLDKSQKHMYELSNKVRLINVKDYPIEFEHAVEKLDSISEKYGVKMTLSVSMNEADFPEKAKSKIIISL